MPNKANQSKTNKNSGQGQRHHPEEQHDDQTQEVNTERSDIKKGNSEHDGNTNRSSNQGRKEASGGSVED